MFPREFCSLLLRAEQFSSWSSAREFRANFRTPSSEEKAGFTFRLACRFFFWKEFFRGEVRGGLRKPHFRHKNRL